MLAGQTIVWWLGLLGSRDMAARLSRSRDQLRSGEAVPIAAATAPVKRFLDEIDPRNEIARESFLANR
jgi:hypothetical protein